MRALLLPEMVDEIGLGTLVVGGRICREVGIDLVVRNASLLLPRLAELRGAGRLGNRVTARSG